LYNERIYIKNIEKLESEMKRLLKHNEILQARYLSNLPLKYSPVDGNISCVTRIVCTKTEDLSPRNFLINFRN
jgi:hypothetical protein